MSQWDPTATGVMQLPSGRLVRGRGLRRRQPEGPEPDFGVYLLGREPAPVAWESRWVRWKDFRLPSDAAALRETLLTVLTRSADQRVELACSGGSGRTGTALACLTVLDGLPAERAVAYVREHYDRGAVETRGQRRFVERFA